MRLSPDMASSPGTSHVFFFNDTATTEIYTLSLHDALPISMGLILARVIDFCASTIVNAASDFADWRGLATVSAKSRSEEHTSELQSHLNLVCRLLLEKKKNYVSERPFA